MLGSLLERASHASYLIFDRQAARSGDPIAHSSTEILPAAPAISGATVPAHVSDHRAEKAGTHWKLEHQYPTVWSQDRSRGPLSTSRCGRGAQQGHGCLGGIHQRARALGIIQPRFAACSLACCGVEGNDSKLAPTGPWI